jgi:RNA polymerase primary sigma factor
MPGKKKNMEALTPPVAPNGSDHSAYHLYLREVGQVPLLTPAEEIKLAKKIKRGNKQARELMIKSNLRLVVKIARDYEGLGVPLLDLISEGNIGLMKAVDRFDPNKGAKLSTYAAWWIKQAIRRALTNQSKVIRVPVHMVDRLSNLRRATAKLAAEFGREPTDEELAEEMDTTPEKIKQSRNAVLSGSSLDAPLGDDDSSPLADVLKDEKALTPYEQFKGQTEVEMLRELLESLDRREAVILRRRFGLDGADEETLEQIGQDFGVTRERIRQLEAVALNKLRKRMRKLDALQFAE